MFPKSLSLVAGAMFVVELLATALAAECLLPVRDDYQPSCTYNGDVSECVVRFPGEDCGENDQTALIYWADGDMTTVWFLSNGSRQADARVILNNDKRGRIVKTLSLADGQQRLYVKSETGNQLSFVL